MIEILKWVLYFIVLLTAWPISLALIKLCRDELKQDKKYFLSFLVVCFILILVCLISYRSIEIILTLVYALVVVGVMFFKSLRIKK